MVRRFKRGLPIKEFKITDVELEGHIFAMGRIGGGKSVSLMSILQGFMDNRNYKIWDIFGGERSEGLYWTIPSQDKEYWENFKAFGTPDEEGPKQYNVNLLYPYFESKLPKKLPKKLPNVQSKLFTIPLKDITTEDIKLALGNLSEASQYTWNEIIHKTKKKDTCAVLLDLSKQNKGINTTLHKSFIVPMIREKFLMNDKCDYNLDLIEEGKNRDIATVLCLDFVPERFHLFIINYIIRKIVDLIESGKMKKRNIVMVREAATFFRATDDSILEDKYKIFRTKMSHYIRMGRRGTYFALDCIEENTKIKTLDGNISLKDLSNEFKLKSYNFNKKIFENDKGRKIFKGKKKCFEIGFEDGRKLQVTSEHKLFNSNGETIKVKNLNVGDSILCI